MLNPFAVWAVLLTASARYCLALAAACEQGARVTPRLDRPGLRWESDGTVVRVRTARWR